MAESLSPPESAYSSMGSPSNGPPKISPRPPIHNSNPRIRRRNRIITSCLECRKRKIKCDKLHPCTNCVKFTRDCLFLAPALDSASQGKLTEIKERMGTLEKVLEQDAARQRGSKSLTPSSPGSSGEGVLSDRDAYLAEIEETVTEGAPLTTEEAMYDEDADDELMDLGVQLGKLRITERIGGFVRPKFGVEITRSLRRVSADGVDAAALANVSAKYHEQNLDSFLGPSPDYIVPQSSFFFPNGASEGNSLMMFLPSRQVADRVMKQYWEAVHPICTTVYRPSFERQYERFWSEISIGFEPSNSLQAVIFAALFSAIISMSNEKVSSEYGVNKFSLADNFRIGCESALSRANLLRTTKIETLQAFVMYLVPLCRAEISRAHAALTATAIRLAECIGLHRDGTFYDLSPIECHVRRLVWYQLCFLDMRCCWASAPRPQIHEEEYDTRLPLNVNEVELEYLIPPKQDADRWTDMTFMLMRFETIEFERFVWVERLKVEKRKTTLTSLLAKIQDFRLKLEKKYIPLMDENVPFQRYAMAYFRMATVRYYVMALHRYMVSATTLLPERLMDILFSAAINVLEQGITLETEPSIKPWAWYNGAYHQYQAAVFLLLTEHYWKPTDHRRDRMWACLDYVFDIPAGLANQEKLALVMGELRDRIEVYSAQRKQKAPTSMNYLKPVPDAYQRPSNANRKPSPDPQSAELKKESVIAAGNLDITPLANSNSNRNAWLASSGAPNSAILTDSFQPYSSTQSTSMQNAPQSDDPAAVLDAARRFAATKSTGMPGPSMVAFNYNSASGYDRSMSNSMSPPATFGADSAIPTPAQNLPIPPIGLEPGDLGMDIDWTELERLFPGTSAEAYNFDIPNMPFNTA